MTMVTYFHLGYGVSCNIYLKKVYMFYTIHQQISICIGVYRTFFSVYHWSTISLWVLNSCRWTCPSYIWFVALPQSLFVIELITLLCARILFMFHIKYRSTCFIALQPRIRDSRFRQSDFPTRGRRSPWWQPWYWSRCFNNSKRALSLGHNMNTLRQVTLMQTGKQWEPNEYSFQ